MKLQRLDHFGVEVRDLSRAEKFYTETLGLNVVARMGDQVLMDCGGQNFAIFEVKRPELSREERVRLIANPLGKGHHAFRVAHGDFLRAREELDRAGMETHQPINWGDHDCMYFLDPDANLLEIVTYR